MGKLAILNTENLWMNNKVRGEKMQCVCVSSIYAEYLQKI